MFAGPMTSLTGLLLVADEAAQVVLQLGRAWGSNALCLLGCWLWLPFFCDLPGCCQASRQVKSARCQLSSVGWQDARAAGCAGSCCRSEEARQGSAAQQNPFHVLEAGCLAWVCCRQNTDGRPPQQQAACPVVEVVLELNTQYRESLRGKPQWWAHCHCRAELVTEQRYFDCLKCQDLRYMGEP